MKSKRYIELSVNETVNNQAMWALERQVPKEPKLHKGMHISDYYTCGNCGFRIDVVYHYCPNCGQRITDCHLGRRKTKEEQNKYHQLNIFDLFDDDSE